MLPTLKTIKAYARTFLPWVMIKITGKDRYLPKILDFNWKENIAHSLLMCYYSLFWRKCGIRHGGLSLYADSTGRREVRVQTWFGVLLFLEHEIIRPLFKWRLQWKEIYIPQLAYATSNHSFSDFKSLKVPVLFAVAYDAAQGNGTGNSSTASFTTSGTVAGSDRFLNVGINRELSSTVNSATFDSVAMTQIGTVNIADGQAYMDMWGIKAPNTGTSKSLSASLSTSTPWQLGANSYTGVDQTTPTNDPQTLADTTTPGQITCTSNIDGSWMIGSLQSSNAGFSLNSGGTLRQQVNGVNQPTLDSNAAINNGNTNTFDFEFSGKGGGVACMIRIASAAGPANLKTWDGLAKASIKTMDGLAIGSVKSWNGLT